MYLATSFLVHGVHRDWKSMRVPSLSKITREAFLVWSVLRLTLLNVSLACDPRAALDQICLAVVGL